jgi:hypothetical protein
MGSPAHGRARAVGDDDVHGRELLPYQIRATLFQQAPTICSAPQRRCTTSCSAHAVSALPVTLTHVQEALNLLAVSIRWMAYAAADPCGEDGPSVDEDSAPPEARALRWHLRSTAEALRDAREACSASEEWSRRLLGEPLEADEDTGPSTAPDELADTVRPQSVASAARSDEARSASGI